MNQEIKQKWVEALKRGEYKQGTGNLRCKDAFCCLGVLCDVYAKEMNLKWHFCESSGKIIGGILGETSYLPLEIINWSGVDIRSPVVLAEHQVNSLVGLNDAMQYTFNQIADLIEEQL